MTSLLNTKTQNEIRIINVYILLLLYANDNNSDCKGRIIVNARTSTLHTRTSYTTHDFEKKIFVQLFYFGCMMMSVF